MTDKISLDAQELESALGILQREQVACVPTERERRLYRWFNICVYSTAALWVFVSASSVFIISRAPGDIVNSDRFVAILGFISLVNGVLTVGAVVLLLLNWGLIRKLYRHAQLRKRLKLANYFANAFSAERKTTVVRNVTTLLMSIAGWLLILTSFFLVGGFILASIEGITANAGLDVVYFVIVILIALVGVSLISFRYVQRGKQRLEVVMRLQTTLTKQATRGDEAKEVEVLPEDYNAIATFERQHIIHDRANSIASGRTQADGPSYLCQSSRQMHLAKSKLTPELLVKVEGAIAELLIAPPLAVAANDAQPERSTMPVAGTGLWIEYDVDRHRNLVRLYDLRTERETSVSAAGGADGIS
jgi:hypothetical protein